ncbi:MAG: excinuclease ABC subunit UvrB [Bacteroidetes bacterium]|nr:excinuclease ABC subunit UvrB [Bacteroidota bacterium]
MSSFKVISDYTPAGDQPTAIKELTEGFRSGEKFQTLLGVTGSGKTFTVAHVVQNLNKPTLVLTHNKTLAAQLYGEIKQFFPDNAVEFFISYYDYYQPEAYIPSSDLYIEKDMSINDEIDRLRLRATSSLLSGRKDVIIVSSVSCIYGIGAPEEYLNQLIEVKVGQTLKRNELLDSLVNIHYVRNDIDFKRGTFRVRGDVIDVIPAYEEFAYRIQFWDNEVEKITMIDPIENTVIGKSDEIAIFPAKHFVTSRDSLEEALRDIEAEMKWRLNILREEGRFLESKRLEERTRFDLEMIREIGYCSGIENYSRHLARRKEGDRPSVLLDYFPKDFLLVIDESHQTIPQIHGMYGGDRSRKINLVEYGFRLPSALDNRPLRFEEFEGMINQVMFVSATPAAYELEKCKGVIAEQIIRPTGLLDPEISVRPVKNQIDDLLAEIRKRVAKNERVLVTTLTKRMSEDLTDYLNNLNVKIRYLHSDIDSLERVEILRGLRLAEFDVLVGINLLREGLDLPEVSLVAILDADKEGFLRSETALIQVAGRAARNQNGLVILYADTITGSMERMMAETKRRRKRQEEYNLLHGITPTTVFKSRDQIMQSTTIADSRNKKEALYYTEDTVNITAADPLLSYLPKEKVDKMVLQLRNEMKSAAKNLEFERAADIRDEIERLQKIGNK